MVYRCINEAAHRIFTGRNFHFHRVRSCKYFTWIVAGDNLQCVDAFLSVKVALIAGGGITLNFLCGPKAKDATAPRIQKMMHCGIYISRESASWDR